MNKALIVGIDHYKCFSQLSGCVNDAVSVRNVLEKHEDGTINFATPKVLTGRGSEHLIKKSQLKDAVRELFSGDSDIALLYFAGHGCVDETGGFLCAGDCETGDDGLSLIEVLNIANLSNAKNKVLVLDSCHSGIAGDRTPNSGIAEIRDGMTILTASTANQYAAEVPGGGAGVFTSLLLDALNGAAANLVGDVTPGSVYAHIDQSLGPWAQRPVFKTNVKTFVSLRKTKPPLQISDLQALTTHFPATGYSVKLDPSFEPERSKEQRDDPTIPPPDPLNTAVFKVLQNYAKVNLVRPVDAPHMWHATMQYKSCKLTVLGEHYRKLVANGLL